MTTDEKRGALGVESGDGEHRRGHRRRTLKQAKAVLSDWTSVDCIVRDQSEEGALLQFNGPVTLPEAFRLILVSAGTIVPVRLLWQRGLQAGLRFAGPAEPLGHHKTTGHQG